jgi:hypothetical protein
MEFLQIFDEEYGLYLYAMKKNIYLIICGIILAAIVTFIVFPSEIASKNQASLREDVKQEAIGANTIPSTKMQKVRWGPTKEEVQIIANTRAVFYGKVVDQNGDPVPSAVINYIPNPNYYDTTQQKIYVTVNTNGEFALNLEKTHSILVGLDAPPGYYPGASSGCDFSFNEIPASTPAEIRKHALPPHQPDPARPVIFSLVKMGRTEPMIERSQSAVLTESNDFKIGTDKAQQVSVKIWVSPDVKPVPGIGGPGVQDWGVELSVRNGGMIERSNPESIDPGIFIAPANGYQKSIRIEYISTMGANGYKNRIVREYFVKFSDDTHGRVEFDIDPDWEMKRHFGSVRSWFNPAVGSTATEFDPTKRIQDSSN